MVVMSFIIWLVVMVLDVMTDDDDDIPDEDLLAGFLFVLAAPVEDLVDDKLVELMFRWLTRAGVPPSW